MFVKVTNKYRDMLLRSELPAGVILEVTDDRAQALIKAEVAEEFNFPAPKAKKTKSEETKVEVKEEEPVVEETIEIVAEAKFEVASTDDGWRKPEATETADK